MGKEPVTTTIAESHKGFWHRYLDEYERVVFSRLDPKLILEFGVGEGSSICWLAQRFPKAGIIGVDRNLLPRWPYPPGVRYMVVDQANRADVHDLFRHCQPDLIIDDGSHVPAHQAHCLVEGFRALRPSGFYIVEDIHTAYVREGPLNAFHLLLAIGHQLEIGTRGMALAAGSYFTQPERDELQDSIKSITTYRRSALPLRCWKCEGTSYDYISLRCSCGVDLYSDHDSMTFMVEKRK